MSAMSAYFSLCMVPCFPKITKLLNKDRIFNNTFTTTQPGFVSRTRPHRVCHPHHMVFSSTLACTVAQVQKHCPSPLRKRNIVTPWKSSSYYRYHTSWAKILTHEGRYELAFDVKWFGFHTFISVVALVHNLLYHSNEMWFSWKMLLIVTIQVCHIIFLHDLWFGQPIQYINLCYVITWMFS